MSQPNIQSFQIDPKENIESVSISGGALTLDLTYSRFAIPLTSSITSMSFTNNNTATTSGQAIILTFTADGTARTVAWPAGDGISTLLVQWPSGIAPTMTSTAGMKDTFVIVSVSQFLWMGFVAGQNI